MKRKRRKVKMIVLESFLITFRTIQLVKNLKKRQITQCSYLGQVRSQMKRLRVSMMAYKEEHLLCRKTTQVQKHLFVGWIISILKSVEPIYTKVLKMIYGNGMRMYRSELLMK